MKINGWNAIIPQLTAFFVVLTRRPGGLTPFNLFLCGLPGSNKTEGILDLAQFLGHRVQLVDASTLDDVSELAGVVDLSANRERGEARLIEGDLLKTDVLVLDEFLNARAHVVPQFRLLLQGHMVMLAKRVPISVQAIIGTGNLSCDMEEGQAQELDSPTADRFAMIVRVPSLSEMSKKDILAILNDECDGSFAQVRARRLEPFLVEPRQQIAVIELDGRRRLRRLLRQPFEFGNVNPSRRIGVPLNVPFVGQHPRHPIVRFRQSNVPEVMEVLAEPRAGFVFTHIGPKREGDGIPRQRLFPLQHEVRQEREGPGGRTERQRGTVHAQFRLTKQLDF